MSKDKKKKDKKAGKRKDKLKSLAQNPVVADVVAAALVATAAALKDSNRAKALASDAADELTKLSRSSTKTGSAMWELALQIGRQSLEALLADGTKNAESKPVKDKPSKPRAAAPARSTARTRKTKADD